MYTNYITDSCFVPKECLSLLLLSSSFFFYCILYIPLSLPPSPPLSTHFYYLREETQEEGRMEGEGKKSTPQSSLCVFYPISFVSRK